VFDHAVRSREHQRFVTVVEADEVRRGTFGATHLDDLTLTLRRSDRAPPDVQYVTDFGSHQITSVPRVDQPVKPPTLHRLLTERREVVGCKSS
jgi:hypothetical protein